MEHPYTIFKLIKTVIRPGGHSHRDPRREDWVLTWFSSHKNEEEAKINLYHTITQDTDLESGWKKVCLDLDEGDLYETYVANRNNLLSRKYFLTTPRYTLHDLETELKKMLSRSTVSAGAPPH